MTEFFREQYKLADVLRQTASSLGNVTTTMTGAIRYFTAQVTRGSNMNSTFIEDTTTVNPENPRENLENLNLQPNLITTPNYLNMNISSNLNETLSELNKLVEINNTQKIYVKRD